jgi:hypothetical protein
MRRNARRCFILAALLIASACQVPQVTPPSTALRQSLGVIVVTTSDEPTLGPIAPPGTVGAAAGAGAGALAGLRVAGAIGGADGSVRSGGGDPIPIFPIIGIAIAPITTLVGAVVGAAIAPSEKEVAAARAKLSSVWSNSRPNAALTRAFLDRVQTFGWTTHVADDGTATLLSQAAPVSNGASAPDTTLQIGVEALDLAYDGGFDPDIHIGIRTFARFSRTADDAELYRASWTIVRKGLSYFTYAKQPTAFQSRIEQLTAIAADEMTRFLFSASSPVDSRLQTNSGSIMIEAKVSALASQAAASSQSGPKEIGQRPQQAQNPASPLPDGTIVLSPAVAAKLQEYLERRPTGPSFFYVSPDGFSGGAYVAGNSWKSDLQAFDVATASLRAKARARSACEAGAEMECVMLFHNISEKQRYVTL